MNKPQLIAPPDIELLVGECSYRFNFYQATWTGGEAYSEPRYIAFTNTAGCNDVYGEGLGWHGAMTDCLNKLMAQGRIKS